MCRCDGDHRLEREHRTSKLQCGELKRLARFVRIDVVGKRNKPVCDAVLQKHLRQLPRDALGDVQSFRLRHSS